MCVSNVGARRRSLAGWQRASGAMPLRSAVALDRAELGRHARVKDAHPLPAQQIEELFSLGIGDHELDFHSVVGGELEKMLFVQNAVPAEPGDSAKRRTAVDADLLGLLEQPFEQRDMAMRP